MARIEFLCLANSKKLGGRCVAGIDLQSDRLIRPITATKNHAFQFANVRTAGAQDFRYLRPLDVIRFDLGEARPSISQPENYRVNDGPWRLVRRVGIDEGKIPPELTRHIGSGSSLLNLPHKGSPFIDATSTNVPSSLALVHVVEPSFRKALDSKIRCIFEYQKATFDLPFTDNLFRFPSFGSSGILTSPKAWLLLISLGEAWQGKNWKLVAGAIPIGIPKQ